MKCQKIAISVCLGVVLLCTTGCFRVSSETRALRDAGLEIAGEGADEQIEVGGGFFTVGLAKLGSRFLELPPEARMVMESVRGAECSVYELRGGGGSMAEVLERADKAMEKRGRERMVGVIEGGQLVAVYVPIEMKSHRDLEISLLVMDERQLVCVKARGDMEPLLEVALHAVKEQLPPAKTVARVAHAN